MITGVFVDNAIKANRDDADMIIMEQTEARKKHIDEVLTKLIGGAHSGRVIASNHRHDCVFFVSVDYDSITACTGQFPAPRSFDRSCVAKFFRRRENCFVRTKVLEKKVWADVIDSVQNSSKSELSSRFFGRLQF